jgi:hypothetical protein
MAALPPRWRLCHARATFVKVESLWEEYRKYTRNLEGWPEKIAPLGRDPGMGAIGQPPETVQQQGNGRPPWVT